MIVVTTSWAPVYAFRKPGMKPYASPAAMPDSTAIGMAAIGGRPAVATPVAAAASPPIRNWPWAPMLNRPALKPMPTARPASTSGVACTRVLMMALNEPTEPATRAT